MVSVLPPRPVTDVHGERKNYNFKNWPCRLQCLGLVEFITYTESVASVFGRHNINHHLFADDKNSLEGVDDVRGRLRHVIVSPTSATGTRPVDSNSTRTRHSKCSCLNKLVNMEQTVTVGASVIQPAAVVWITVWITVSYSTKNSAWLNTSRSDVIMFLPTGSIQSDTSFRTGTRRLAGALVRSFEAWLRQLCFCRSAKVGDHAASTRSERSSAADSRPTDERTRDTSSEAAPLVVRRPSSGLQILHHDAINPHQAVSDVFYQYGACCRRQPDEVWSAIRRHLSIL